MGKQSSEELRAIDTRINKVQFDVDVDLYAHSVKISMDEMDSNDFSASNIKHDVTKIVIDRVDSSDDNSDTELSDSGSLNRLSMRNSLNVVSSDEDEDSANHSVNRSSE